MSSKKTAENERTTIINGNKGIIISGNTNRSMVDTTFNITQEPQSNARFSKKRKLVVDDNNCWAIDNQDDFWSSWQQYFDECECHAYCLEKYHIIECGYTIQCKPSYDVDLYEQLGNNAHQIVKSPFARFADYSSKAVAAVALKNERKMMNALMNDDHWEEIEKGCNSHIAIFVYNYFTFIKTYMPSASRITDSESMYNHHLVWGLLDLAVKTAITPATKLAFETGEVLLDSFDEIFKADGVVKTLILNAAFWRPPVPMELQTRVDLVRTMSRARLGL